MTVIRNSGNTACLSAANSLTSALKSVDGSQKASTLSLGKKKMVTQTGVGQSFAKFFFVPNLT